MTISTLVCGDFACKTSKLAKLSKTKRLSHLWLVAWWMQRFAKALSLSFIQVWMHLYASFCSPKLSVTCPSHASRKIQTTNAVILRTRFKVLKEWHNYFILQMLTCQSDIVSSVSTQSFTELSSHLSNVSAVKRVANTRSLMLNCQSYRRYWVKMEKRKQQEVLDNGLYTLRTLF